MEKIKILGISGSLRQGSFNTSALRAIAGFVTASGKAAETAGAAGVEAEMEIYVPSDIPPFNGDFEQDMPAPIRDFKAKIRAADALIFSSPEYNYSISGVMKNALDCASRPYGDNPFAAKPGAILGVSNGRFGTARAYYDLYKVVSGLNIFAMNYPQILITNGGEKFDASGNLVDQETAEKLKAFTLALIEWTKKLKVAGLAK